MAGSHTAATMSAHVEMAITEAIPPYSSLTRLLIMPQYPEVYLYVGLGNNTHNYDNITFSVVRALCPIKI